LQEILRSSRVSAIAMVDEGWQQESAQTKKMAFLGFAGNPMKRF
jgi:hypothetical protein